MPTTRAQKRELTQGRDEDTAEQDSSDSEAELPEAPSKIEYSRRDLSPAASKRLDAAFEGHFTVAHCAEHNVSSGPRYYAFQIAETTAYSVRIGAPGSNYSNAECFNCNEPQPCRHIFWLLDHINKHTLTDAQKKGPLTLSKGGFPSEVPGPFERITKVGMEDLAERLHWELRPPYYEEPDHEAKAQEIREIMAALSPRTANEYRPDIFGRLAMDQSFENALAQRDLETLLAQLLMVNSDMFHYFRALVSPNHCAADFFMKMRERGDEAISLFSRYIQSGPTEDKNEIYDIPWCARRLTDIVDQIRNKVFESTLGKSAKAEAAETLIHILEEVVDRNSDAYAGAVWAGTPQRRLSDKERNLFIRCTAPSTEPPFIINELNYLTDASQHLVDRVEAIGEQMPKGGAPSTYTAKLRELIPRMKRGDIPRVPKRPGSEMSSDSKRMK